MSNNNRPYHHGDLRNELIRVGLELIAEGGTEAVGLRESARRIGVSASAAYRHFDNRADLVDAVRDQVLRNLANDLRQALAQHRNSDIATRLEIIGRTYFTFAVENPQQFQALATSFPLAEDWATSSDRPLKIVLENMAGLKLPQEDLGNEAMSIWAVVHGAASLATIGSLRNVSLERKWALLDRTIEILLKGLALR